MTVGTKATHVDTDVSTLFANTIRMLAVDAAEQAKSGHPGAPMGQADMAFVLFGVAVLAAARAERP